VLALLRTATKPPGCSARTEFAGGVDHAAATGEPRTAGWPSFEDEHAAAPPHGVLASRRSCHVPRWISAMLPGVSREVGRLHPLDEDGVGVGAG